MYFGHFEPAGHDVTNLGADRMTNGTCRKLVLGTKVHPSQQAGLSERGIRTQLEESMKAMKVSSVDVLYLHQPDPDHDLKDSWNCDDLDVFFVPLKIE